MLNMEAGLQIAGPLGRCTELFYDQQREFEGGDRFLEVLVPIQAEATDS